jgi:hypothetical protein
LKLLNENRTIRFLFIAVPVVSTPVVLNGKLWAAVWHGELSRAWDGTGHSAIAQIYDQTIFPNTFGWTNAYFGGMPFPNFYPPLFYWCVALLQRTHLFSFATAFKLMVVLSVLLVPAAIWILAWFLSNRNRIVATASALAGALLLVDVRIMGTLLAGLDYFSTFQIGLYTQPLGFVLMIAWFVVYSGIGSTNSSLSDRAGRMRALPSARLALSALLLALTVLSNFFVAITAAVFILATVSNDLVHLHRAAKSQQMREERNALLRHLLSPVIALLLTLFWIVPMIAEYKYFVTRPFAPETQSLFSPWLMAWYAVAVLGSIAWWRGHKWKGADVNGSLRAARRRRDKYGAKARSGTWASDYPISPTSGGGDASLLAPAMRPYLATCLFLALAVIFSATLAPSWFPLQAPRFLATLTFLLTVPVGFAVACAFGWLARLFEETAASDTELSFRRARYSSVVAIVLFLLLALTAPSLGWIYAFYPKGAKTPIDGVLEFARQHRDGRYLVEVINPKLGAAWTEASFDARAINSYLGSQGNESISGVFHEASPNALFTLPVVNAFSNYPDSFGVSSVLADDLDFAARPLLEQVKRAQFLGVKYLVIRTPAMKERVNKELTSAIRHDIGWWAVFELPGATSPKIQALPYKPALVLSSFTVKARRRNEMSFIRLAEEQFADNWFDVLLARSPESNIDQLTDLDRFGALILDRYDYSNEEVAFQRLREFSKTRVLICLSDDNRLFHRVEAARSEFSLLEIVERPPEEPGETIEVLKPSYHYGSSSIRQRWKSIRGILERNKISTGADPSHVEGEINQNTMRLANKTSKPTSMPVLIATTFHPKWQRDDGAAIYAVTPFYMLTFIEQPISISYQRTGLDRLGIWLSGMALVALCLLVVVRYAARSNGFFKFQTNEPG